MVPAGNKAKRLSSVNRTTKTIHHHHQTFYLTLSEQSAKLFPDVGENINPINTSKIPQLTFDQLSEILSKIDKGEVPKQLDSFEGGPNQEFESRAQLLGLSTNSSKLLDYLLSGFCEDLLKNNRLKIHIETGNIYYDNNDTNESIYGFFQQQEDE